MSEEEQTPKYSVCPTKCKLSHLAPQVISEIDLQLGQNATYESIIEQFPLANLNSMNLSTHKRKHLDMAKVCSELQANPRPLPYTSIEYERKQIQENNPHLAAKLKGLESIEVTPYKSIDLVTARIKLLLDVIEELSALEIKPHRLIALYEQLLQRYLEINSRLMGEYRQTENTVDMSQAISWMVKEKKKQGAWNGTVPNNVE
jgi:hypothetical protein